MTSALIPCPFCGESCGKVERFGEGHHAVLCHNCSAEGPACAGSDNAAESWNRRDSGWWPIESAPTGDEVLVAVGQRVTVAMKSMGEWYDQCGMPDAFDRLPKCRPTHWQTLPQPPKG